VRLRQKKCAWTIVEADGDGAAGDPTRRSGHWASPPLLGSLANGGGGRHFGVVSGGRRS
jgi:hypothetical protein